MKAVQIDLGTLGAEVVRPGDEDLQRVRSAAFPALPEHRWLPDLGSAETEGVDASDVLAVDVNVRLTAIRTRPPHPGQVPTGEAQQHGVTGVRTGCNALTRRCRARLAAPARS